MESGAAAAERVKLGLALSGGGFRASLFHIGVLAQLADMGLLRRVEAISTVSGGSIIGALYYLYLRALLERKSDEDISDGDYQQFVAELLAHFLRVVQLNLRMRTFQRFSKNLKMFQPSYSRSDHMGELLDQYLYRPAFGGAQKRMVEMREIKVTPLKNGKPQTAFKPKTDNAGRLAKVPIILINTTDLNSGHNWRFEASRMGEHDRRGPNEMEVDRNMRLLRPPSYEDVVKKQQNIELGLAVGASAAVPGLFPPLAISDLYQGIRVALVDGGVHDNQGVQALIDREVACTHFVVSDASGPLQDEAEPQTGPIAVSARANDAQFDRVREEQLLALMSTHGQRVAYMHLRKGLTARTVTWNLPDGKPAAPESVEQPVPPTSAAFGIDEEVQDRLSRIRTDLDSFSDIEAYSLMLDGYNMSRLEFKALRDTMSADDVPQAKRVRDAKDWAFLSIAPWAGNRAQKNHSAYLERLQVGAHRFFKAFRLSTALALAGIAALALALAGAYILLKEQIHWVLDQPLWTLLLVLAGAVLVRFAPKLWKAFDVLRLLRKPAELVTRFVGMFVVAALGALTVRIHLLTVDRLFLWMGRVERLK